MLLSNALDMEFYSYAKTVAAARLSLPQVVDTDTRIMNQMTGDQLPQFCPIQVKQPPIPISSSPMHPASPASAPVKVKAKARATYLFTSRNVTKIPSIHYLVSHNWSEIRSQNEKFCVLDSGSKPYFKVQKCVVLFFHIHKSGGTTICHAANRHLLKTTLNSNCNLPTRQTNADGINNYEKYMIANQLNFGAMEYGPFRPNPFSSKTLYIMSVRHPIDRILSDYSHSFCRSSTVLRAYPCLKELAGQSLSQLFNESCFQEFCVQLNTNYYIKQLAGCANDNCTRKDLELAKRALDIMSVIIITDTTDTYKRYDV